MLYEYTLSCPGKEKRFAEMQFVLAKRKEGNAVGKQRNPVGKPRNAARMMKTFSVLFAILVLLIHSYFAKELV
ncbi:MAG: hypothetical protein HFG59_13725 [Lachnospiraceae bacterium]|jgi:hypothetical protein|nr:hypothetical protein [Lachnospiraceae bacterium]